MAEKKTIMEEAMLDMKTIQTALNANTKEILRSIAKEEIDSVVKESLVKEIYEEEDLDTDETSYKKDGKDVETKETSEEDSTDDITSPEVVDSAIEPALNPEIEKDADALDGEEMDMTTASDEDVIAIYKKLSGEDEIEIVGDEIHINISEPGEYIVKADDVAKDDTAVEIPTELEPVGDEDGGTDYEIEMGDDDTDEDAIPDDLVDVDGEEEEIEENIANTSGYAGRQGAKRSGSAHLGFNKSDFSDKETVKESLKSKELLSEVTKKYNNVLTEARKLKSENEQFRGALKKFKNQLVETVILNSNLMYITRLFTEHTTTRTDKQTILKRFQDSVTSIKESKMLYRTIVNELESKKTLSETIERKANKEITSSSSKQLTENTVYVDPFIKRTLDLINRVEKR